MTRDDEWSATIREGNYGSPPSVRVQYQVLAPPDTLFRSLEAIGWRIPPPGPRPKEAIDWSTPDPATGEAFTILPWTAQIDLITGDWPDADIDSVIGETRNALETVRSTPQLPRSTVNLLILADTQVGRLWRDRFGDEHTTKMFAVAGVDGVTTNGQAMSVLKQLSWIEVDLARTDVLDDPDARPLFSSGWVFQRPVHHLGPCGAGEQPFAMVLEHPAAALINQLSGRDDQVSFAPLKVFPPGTAHADEVPEVALVETSVPANRGPRLASTLLRRARRGYWRHEPLR